MARPAFWRLIILPGGIPYCEGAKPSSSPDPSSISTWKSANSTFRALTPERVGTFDVVLFLGVFYHLLDPIAALTQIAALAREVLIVETHTDALETRRPAMIMYPGAELDGDESNWWGPNPACMVALLKQCGFAKVDAAWTEVGYRTIYHAWRTDELRRSGSRGERRMAVPYPLWLRTRRLLGKAKRALGRSSGRGTVKPNGR